MSTLPETSRETAVSDAEAATSLAGYVCVATFLPVRRWRDVLPFQRIVSRIRRQRTAPGLVDYELRANFRRKHFWTLSVWRDRAAITTFRAQEPHTTAMRRFQERAGEGAAFVSWKSAEPMLDWEEAMRRLTHPARFYQP